ncbi:hypothetical protein MVEN_02565100 [Mycena venus]|uniref:Uncharacterized protein n=1 Tax=Mycena venus TaxID=2733690 RepID=A0A8H6U3R3_9AGAR|nr:hypothetical protein MVEN_02565100 [Mycena venus]
MAFDVPRIVHTPTPIASVQAPARTRTRDKLVHPSYMMMTTFVLALPACVLFLRVYPIFCLGPDIQHGVRGAVSLDIDVQRGRTAKDSRSARGTGTCGDIRVWGEGKGDCARAEQDGRVVVGFNEREGRDGDRRQGGIDTYEDISLSLSRPQMEPVFSPALRVSVSKWMYEFRGAAQEFSLLSLVGPTSVLANYYNVLPKRNHGDHLEFGDLKVSYYYRRYRHRSSHAGEVEPKLPPELERVPFEAAPASQPVTILKLILFAHRIQAWVASCISDSFSIAGFPFVEQLYEPADLPPPESLLRACTGITRLYLRGLSLDFTLLPRHFSAMLTGAIEFHRCHDFLELVAHEGIASDCGFRSDASRMKEPVLPIPC